MNKLRAHLVLMQTCLVVVVVCACRISTKAQGTCDRIMIQDSSINNLVDPEGITTVPIGSLGEVSKIGSGPQAVIFIPGLGFGGDVFEEYLADHTDKFTGYLITLPGFGSTPPPPSPAGDVSFGDQAWTNAAMAAVEKLLLSNDIDRPVLIGHWLTGTQIALRLALTHPDQVKGVIIVAGAACFVGDTTRFPAHPPLEMRIASIDQYMVPSWFKTVTRETWDDNNYLPGDYAVNPIRGLRLWRQAASPQLHVWVRYLCEFFAQDISLALDSLHVPTLLLKPGLEGNFVETGNDYMRAYCHTSWEASVHTNDKIRVVTIPNSRVFIWFDQPERFNGEVEAFIRGLD